MFVCACLCVSALIIVLTVHVFAFVVCCVFSVPPFVLMCCFSYRQIAVRPATKKGEQSVPSAVPTGYTPPVPARVPMPPRLPHPPAAHSPAQQTERVSPNDPNNTTIFIGILPLLFLVSSCHILFACCYVLCICQCEIVRLFACVLVCVHIINGYASGGVDYTVTMDLLKQYFAPYGEIKAVKIPPNKGCAFLEYATHEQAQRVLTEMPQVTQHMIMHYPRYSLLSFSFPSTVYVSCLCTSVCFPPMKLSLFVYVFTESVCTSVCVLKIICVCYVVWCVCVSYCSLVFSLFPLARLPCASTGVAPPNPQALWQFPLRPQTCYRTMPTVRVPQAQHRILQLLQTLRMARMGRRVRSAHSKRRKKRNPSNRSNGRECLRKRDKKTILQHCRITTHKDPCWIKIQNKRFRMREKVSCP